jgi:hypothetical protein
LIRLRQLGFLIAAMFLVVAGIYFVLARRGPVASPSGLTYMPLGDSITQAGYPSFGYRRPLQARLVNAGYNTTAVGLSGFLDRGFLGRFLGWSNASDCPDNWEGHGSYTTAEIHAWFDADNSIRQLKPNIILALVGTVDVRRGNISQAPNDVRNMLTDILRNLPIAGLSFQPSLRWVRRFSS